MVDDFFYQPISTITITPKGDTFRFLHVSCFDEKAKNVQGMLRAVRKLANKRQDFELIIVGTGVDHTQTMAYAEQLQFPNDMLTFTGEQTPYQVAQWMQQSDCFVLFSNYENAPVVLSECLATGLPIISSRAGGIPEMITETDGILVNTQDERQLTNAMLWMMEYTSNYLPLHIREHGCLEAVYVLDALVFHRVCKSFLLYSCHIQDVTIIEIIVQRCCLDVFYSLLVKELLVLLRHLELFRCSEYEFRIEV